MFNKLKNKTKFLPIIVIAIAAIIIPLSMQKNTTVDLPKTERSEIFVEAVELVEKQEEVIIEESSQTTTTTPIQEEEKKEEVSSPVIAKVEAPKVAPKPAGKTPIEQGKFPKNGGGIITYDTINNHCNSNADCVKLRQAFTDRFGDRVGKKAMVTLFYENGTFWSKTVGVCSKKYQINGDYRNCNYADINSAGLDAGLKQINTWFQRKRIAKLGGANCTPKNSRDRSDSCNQQLIEWLHNVDNNIKIALDIYSESGFSMWVGARRANINNYS
jgi:hypothetical protein